MLEEWVWDADSLSKFARNAQGETIPAELVERLNAGRDFGQGLFVHHQMFYAALSLNLYNRDPEGLNLTDTVRELQTKYSPFPYVEDTYFHTRSEERRVGKHCNNHYTTMTWRMNSD